MPIMLVTGLPGSGKTYFSISKALSFFPQELNGQPRQIFYDGIPELKLGWQECRAQDWPSLPDGSIVIIDEAQRIFPVPPVGAKRPDHVGLLNTHRHRGFDFVLITQRANLIDSHVRALCQPHIHIERPFGFARANVFQWESVRDSIDWHAKRDAQKTSQTFKPEVWSNYKSTTHDTVKRRVPGKLYLLGAAVVALLVVGAFAIWKFNDMRTGDAAKRARGVLDKPEGAQNPQGSPYKGELRITPTKGWIEAHEPRLPGLLHTAPRYEELTTPVVVPKVVGCHADLTMQPPRCTCYTQQRTIAEVTYEFCGRWITGGKPFLDYEQAPYDGTPVGLGDYRTPGQGSNGPPRGKGRAPPPVDLPTPNIPLS